MKYLWHNLLNINSIYDIYYCMYFVCDLFCVWVIQDLGGKCGFSPLYFWSEVLKFSYSRFLSLNFKMLLDFSSFSLRIHLMFLKFRRIKFIFFILLRTKFIHMKIAWT